MVLLSKDSGMVIAVNAATHGVILFIVWAVLFNILVKKLAKEALNSQMKNLVDKTVQQNFTLLPSHLKIFLYKMINNNSFDDSQYNEESDSTKLQNKWISCLSVVVPLIGVAFVVAIAVSLQKTCNASLPLKHILLENAITFAMIGCVEYYLFTNIALKYVPVKPSAIGSTLVQQMKKGLAC